METLIHQLRVPQQEPYSFIEFQFAGTAEEAIGEYHRLTRVAESTGLPPKEWNAWLDSYLAGKAGDPDEWEQMSVNQKLLVNEIKKSRKRLEAKNK